MDRKAIIFGTLLAAPLVICIGFFGGRLIAGTVGGLVADNEY